MCHPNQSEFLNASKVVKNPDTGKEMVKELEYHVTEGYAAKVYKSCADVVNPSTSGKYYLTDFVEEKFVNLRI